MPRSYYMAWVLPSFFIFSTSRLVAGLTCRRLCGTFGNPTSGINSSKMTISSCATGNELATVSDFVRSVKNRLASVSIDMETPVPPHLVIGNEAGDADSILSAIGLAYVRALQSAGDNNNLVVPIISIPADTLKFQRPETTFLLSACAGMENVKANINDLIAIDQHDLLPKQATLTLTDHNFFRGKQAPEWIVTEIIDHHLDEGKHTDTCPTSKRIIAFEDSQALVASTTTLVAEQFYSFAGSSKMPPSLAILLLGTILLDSINMSSKAGKGTPRDAAVIRRLMDDTDWAQLNLPDNILDTDGCTPNATKLFDELQNAKFSPEFWNGLTAEQAIRMDFKSFSIPTTGSPSMSTLGIGSILLEMSNFFDTHGDTIVETIAQVIDGEKFKILALMFNTFGSGDERRRQIALASYDKSTLEKLIEYLMVDANTTPVLNIEIVCREDEKIGKTGETLHVVRMEQGNVNASRKQVAPIMMDFFKDHC